MAGRWRLEPLHRSAPVQWVANARATTRSLAEGKFELRIRDLLAGGEQRRINCRGAGRGSDRTHRFADGVDEARVAFSIRCPRLATWTASGSGERMTAIAILATTEMCGRPVNQASALAGSRSVRRAMVFRQSRSQPSVP